MDINELGREYNDLLQDEDELEEDDRERLEELRKLNDELDDSLYYYNTADIHVVEDGASYAEEWIGEVMGVDLDSNGLKWYFDFEKYWDEHLAPDYDEVEWEGTTYHVRLY